jgi:rfaE bifunctional protein nucleotidyltransferase chain/domain
VSCADKIIPFQSIAGWCYELHMAGKRLVVTNGCFDILHVGHVTYMEQAKKLGDVLLVGVNSDAAVRELKGESRPINCAADRATVLSAIESVDAVCVFPGLTAETFLCNTMPDVYVKGGDYTMETINQDERRTVESLDGKVVILPLVFGKSTTSILVAITQTPHRKSSSRKPPK